MNVLALNCGSSSLKFRLFRLEAADGAAQVLAGGGVSAIGSQAAISFERGGAAGLRESAAIPDHAAAVERMLDWLGGAASGTIDAVGHRVVHGGDRFVQAARIDAPMLVALKALTELAPLHNGPALAAIEAIRGRLGAALPMVATFDTAFHQTMPPRAASYALPWELAQRHGIRRFGFHGLAHRSMMGAAARAMQRPAAGLKLVTLQLGSGCSAAAIDRGRSIDTTMGFTPLEGLMMGTRSGDLDPSLPAFLAEREGVVAATIDEWLNRRSGLLGVSGRSSDVPELLRAEAEGDARAALALEMFCYRVRKTIGAYLAVLGGADALVFGGGIGEHAAEIRRRICDQMDWCGLELDGERNAAPDGEVRRISRDGARVAIYVAPVDEEAIIAHDTVNCLTDARPV